MKRLLTIGALAFAAAALSACVGDDHRHLHSTHGHHQHDGDHHDGDHYHD